jgi:hypothetical protein
MPVRLCCLFFFDGGDPLQGSRQDEAASLLAQLTLAMENATLEPYELEVIHRSQKLAAKLNVQVS